MLALMAVVGIVSFTNTSSLVTNSEWVQHTCEVITETDAVLSSLSDAGAGQRGYPITGVRANLEPYTAAREEVAVHAEALRDLTSDNAVQQARLDELAPLIEAKFEEMQAAIDVRSNQGFDASRAIVLTDAPASPCSSSSCSPRSSRAASPARSMRSPVGCERSPTAT